MTYQHLTTKELEGWLNVNSKDVPSTVILQGTWPWEKIEQYAKKIFKFPKKISNLGNFMIGVRDGTKIGYMIVYGPGMAADMCYVLIKLGVKNIFLVGGIGALQKNIKIGDLIVSQQAITTQDGTSWFYSSKEIVNCDKKLLGDLKRVLEKKNVKNCFFGETLSISTLFAESKSWVNKWNKKGVLGVDMETSAVYTICKALDAKVIALLLVTDNVVSKEGTLVATDRNKEVGRVREKTGRLILDIVTETIKLVR